MGRPLALGVIPGSLFRRLGGQVDAHRATGEAHAANDAGTNHLLGPVSMGAPSAGGPTVDSRDVLGANMGHGRP